MKKILLTTSALVFLAFPACAADGDNTAPAPVLNVPSLSGTVSAGAADAHSKSVELRGNSGKLIGSASISGLPDGIFVDAAVTDLLPGWHAFHIHAAGDCSDTAEFKKAGGHLKHEGQMHGVMAEKGPHAGDLPNIWVGKDGTGRAEFFSTHATWADLTGTDGSAFIVHAGPDDYKTDPSGSAGARVACGVISVKKAEAAPAK